MPPSPESAPHRAGPPAAAPVAVVDVGTNSVRLLIAGPAGDGQQRLHVHDRRMTITRLGQGVDAIGQLDDDALDRTMGVLAEYAHTWRAAGVQRVRITATSAVRDAADRERFFSAVRERTGVTAEVLSGSDEARAAFAGATTGADGTPPYAVLDIGGGSTEVIYGRDTPEVMTSRQLGCVRLTEQILRSDPPTAAEIAQARGLVDVEWDAVAYEVDPVRAATLIGVAGTVTTMAALHLGLERYDPARIHGTAVPAPGVRALTQHLLGLSKAERARLGPMEPGRADVIGAGALILDRFCQRFGFAVVVASEADILDGLALGLLGDATPGDATPGDATPGDATPGDGQPGG